MTEIDVQTVGMDITSEGDDNDNSHQVCMNGPSYRPSKAPGRVVPTGNTTSS